MPRQLRFFAVYYTPNILTERSIGIGIVLIDPEGGFNVVRFLQDWQEVLVFDPNADIQMLEALGRDIAGRFRRGEGEEMLRVMEDSFSNAVQLSPAITHSANDPAKEIERLAAQYLGKPRPPNSA